jgi:hypothetical protein
MKKLIFLLEEQSMKETLENILPLVIPNEISFLCIPHEGKADLQKSIPRKLLRWRDLDVRFMIAHDQDSAACRELKKELISLVPDEKRKETRIRIVCTELESWFLGDLQAYEASNPQYAGLLKVGYTTVCKPSPANQRRGACGTWLAGAIISEV